MSAQPGDAPTARTLFRSPAKPAAGAVAVTPPAVARDLRAKALSTRQAVDLSSKSGLRRALGEILLDVERAGGAGLDAAGFGAARTVVGHGTTRRTPKRVSIGPWAPPSAD